MRIPNRSAAGRGGTPPLYKYKKNTPPLINQKISKKEGGGAPPSLNIKKEGAPPAINSKKEGVQSTPLYKYHGRGGAEHPPL